MKYQKLYVSKTTDTLADALLAYGLSRLVEMLIPLDEEFDFVIVDDGACYVIEFEQPFESEWLESHLTPISLYPYIQTKNFARPNNIRTYVDYEEETDRKKKWFEMRAKLSQEERKRAEVLFDEHNVTVSKPSSQSILWSPIVVLRAITSYNATASNWHQHAGEIFPQLLMIIFSLFSSPYNDIEGAKGAWKALKSKYKLKGKQEVTATQLVSPGMGKGNNKEKPSGVSENPLNDFWLIVHLRFAGLYQVGTPKIVRDETKKLYEQDSRLYVPIPLRLSWNTATRDVFSEYRETLSAQTSTKLDILAALHYLDVYLKHWIRDKQENLDPLLPNMQPGNYSRAISAVHFKKTHRNTSAVMRIYEVPVPNWIKEMTNIDEARRYQHVIQEHKGVIRALIEQKRKNSPDKQFNDYELLQQYRRFLSTNDLDKFLEFLGGYSDLLMSRLNIGQKVHQFSLSNLEVTLMNIDNRTKEIISNEGFRAIAAAIRYSTVVQQNLKAAHKKGKRTDVELVYDIRYGLGDKLFRAARDTNDPYRFIKELTDFMHLYSRETARVEETRGIKRRPLITLTHIEQMADLISNYKDCELIAGLLVACGYAYDDTKSKSQPEGGE
jgi:hypothetical protein